MHDKLRLLTETISNRCLSQHIKAKHKDLHEWIMKESTELVDVKFNERIWYILNEKPKVVCALGKKKTFNPKTHSYGFCDNISKCQCMSLHLSETYVPRDMGIVVDKRKKTWLEKYGVENPSQSPELQAKRLATIQSRDYSIQRKLTAYQKESVGYDQVVERVSSHVTPMFTRETYTGSRHTNLYDWKCVKCDHEFQDHIDNGSFPKCTQCFPKQNWSVGELEVADYVTSLGETIVRNDRTVLGNRELDIYIPAKKIAIEYNGIYWHSSEKKDNSYHVDKFLRCRDLGIHLIQIFEDEWDRSKEIVKKRLGSILGHNERIFARKCNIVEVPVSAYKEFVITNHLAGYAHATFRYGLEHDGELVAVMSFARSRYTDSGSEMIRYCSTANVVGGASKLLKHFITVHNPPNIVTYANRCWSEGNLYRTIGFTDVTTKDNNVGYWYIRNGIRHHRSSFTKTRLVKLGYSAEKTEGEIMSDAGYHKIYDCGNYKFLWTNPIILI